MEKRSKEEWARIIGRQRESGESAKGWCAANGINHHTFTDRVQRLKKEGERKGPVWVEAKVEAKKDKAEEIYIETGIFRIKLSSAFDEVTLSRACKVLMSLC